jgi:ribosome maturation factor RimP
LYICTPIVRWCNGSTADFGSACPGSNPGRTTKVKRERFGGDRCPLFLLKMISEQQIRRWAEEQLEGTDRFVVHVKVSHDNVIHVVIDSDTGVTIEHCMMLSRYIEQHLDRDKEDFELKVLSSGLEFPFSLLRQYKKYVGKRIQLKLADNTEKKGILREAEADHIILQEETEKKYKKTTKRITGETVRIPMNEIKQAKAVIEF